MLVDEMMINGEEKMEKAITRLKTELAKARTGRANPAILDRVTIDYYGAPTPLRQLANVSVQEGTVLAIQPFDKGILHDIEKAIFKADIGITPSNDGNVIRISFPPLTEDRRKEIVKDVKKQGEEGKVAVRNVRRDMTDVLKKLEKSENLPEDQVKGLQDDIQKLTDDYVKQVESLVAAKEKEVLTV